MRNIFFFFAGLLVVASANAGAMSCPGKNGIALQVLGSGGPIADDGRASSAYLVWVDGHARVMVDAGGGAFLRFGKAGARFEDLDLVALSHFHTDHSADFPALLKSGYFSPRKRPLPVSGPAGKGPFPGLKTFMDGLLDGEHGAFGYLSGYLAGTDGLVKLNPVEVPLTRQTHSVLETNELRVHAMPVPHGIVPALAFRVDWKGTRLVFAADQNADDESFAEFARNADLLVMHMAIPGEAGTAAQALHATPREIGRLAEQSQARQLVLSHFMARSLANIESNVAEVKSEFKGMVHTAVDLDCYHP